MGVQLVQAAQSEHPGLWRVFACEWNQYVSGWWVQLWVPVPGAAIFGYECEVEAVVSGILPAVAGRVSGWWLWSLDG